MTRCVVFDLDGTLVEGGPQIVRAMRAAYASVGLLAPDEPDIHAIIGISLPMAVEVLSPELDRDTRDRIVSAYRRAFQADSAAPPLYQGAREALVRLHGLADTALAIATGKTRRGLIKVLDQHGLRPLFRALHAGDMHRSKPDPAMLLAAIAECGSEPDKAVMVGDSIHDIQMAAAAGVRSVGVSWGYFPVEALRAAGASAVVADFEELMQPLAAASEVAG